MTDHIESECMHGMTLAFCSWCKDKPAPQNGDRSWGWEIGVPPSPYGQPRPPTMEANYESLCPDCSATIDPGDTIALREGSWVCAGCGVTHDIQAARAAHPSGGTNANP